MASSCSRSSGTESTQVGEWFSYSYWPERLSVLLFTPPGDNSPGLSTRTCVRKDFTAVIHIVDKHIRVISERADEWTFKTAGKRCLTRAYRQCVHSDQSYPQAVEILVNFTSSHFYPQLVDNFVVGVCGKAGLNEEKIVT